MAGLGGSLKVQLKDRGGGEGRAAKGSCRQTHQTQLKDRARPGQNVQSMFYDQVISVWTRLRLGRLANKL